MTPRPPALPAALDHFETALADGGAIDRLRQIGAPPFVGFLFRLEARRRVKMGPRVDPSGPADLLRAAQEAARSGVAPVSAPVAVRRLLAEAAEEVRRVGAWRRDRPFWWQPLPRPSRSERLWGRLERSWEAAFPPDGLVVARDHPWRWLPGVLPAELCSALFRRLEGLHARGTLTLEQGRVGSGGGGADARADEVRLLTGYEGDLLRQAPPLGVLVQWCLEQLAPSLARSWTTAGRGPACST
jgi:hypothetical protein